MSERDSLIPDVDDVERASRRASSSSRAASRAVAGSSAEGVGRHVVFNMRVASALFFAGTTLLAMGAIVGRSADAARASALGEGAGGTCALSPMGAGANAAANTCAARYMDELGLWDAADAGDNVEFETKVYECMNEPTGAPVVVPRDGVAKPFATKPGSAYAWIFVHIPKAAGSVFIEMLKQNKNHETVVLHEPAHPDFLVNPWRPLNSLQARHVPTMLRTFKQNRESKSGTFSKEFMHADYDEGRRMYFTGATGIGMCGTVDAPCAYITVLREPMSRLWSEYTYLCLEANEGHLSWTAEEIAADNHQGCPLNPLEWYNQKRSTAAQLTGLLARAAVTRPAAPKPPRRIWPRRACATFSKTTSKTV